MAAHLLVVPSGGVKGLPARLNTMKPKKNEEIRNIKRTKKRKALTTDRLYSGNSIPSWQISMAMAWKEILKEIY